MFDNYYEMNPLDRFDNINYGNNYNYNMPYYTQTDNNQWSYNYTNYDNYSYKNEITPIGSTGNSHFGYVKPINEWHISTPLPGFGKKEGFDNGFTWHDNLNDFNNFKY